MSKPRQVAKDPLADQAKMEVTILDTVAAMGKATPEAIAAATGYPIKSVSRILRANQGSATRVKSKEWSIIPISIPSPF